MCAVQPLRYARALPCASTHPSAVPPMCICHVPTLSRPLTQQRGVVRGIVHSICRQSTLDDLVFTQLAAGDLTPCPCAIVRALCLSFTQSPDRLLHLLRRNTHAMQCAVLCSVVRSITDVFVASFTSAQPWAAHHYLTTWSCRVGPLRCAPPTSQAWGLAFAPTLDSTHIVCSWSMYGRPYRKQNRQPATTTRFNCRPATLCTGIYILPTWHCPPHLPYGSCSPSLSFTCEYLPVLQETGS